MKINKKSQSHQGYKVHTNQKAGDACPGHMNRVNSGIKDCVQDPKSCDVARDIICMTGACQSEPIPCPL